MSVPGSIFSELSAGTNNLIKAGATPVTSLADILLALDLTLTTSNKPLPEPRNSDEAIIIELMNTGITDSNELLALSKLSASAFNQTLTMLEISGSIKPLGAGHWTL